MTDFRQTYSQNKSDIPSGAATWGNNTVVRQLSILLGPYKAVQYNKQALAPNIRKQRREMLTKVGFWWLALKEKLNAW